MTSVPLGYSFWFMLVAYVVHIIDESLLGGSFVEKVREHWWPKYSWRKFFWLNTGYLLLMFASILLYDRIGRAALWLPLAWAIERFFNAVWHVWWSIHFREYSPGLLTSLLIWMQTYFIVVCRPPSDSLELHAIWLGIILGLFAAAFVSFYMPLVANKTRA